jgi:hypothetical protein
MTAYEQQTAGWIPIATMPGVYLVSTNPDNMGAVLLRRVARCVALHASQVSHDAAERRQLRQALRHLHDPLVLGRLPLALRFTGSLAQRGALCAEWLCCAITRLALFRASDPVDLRGTVLALRFVDGLSIRQICQQLWLSERQMYRMQAAGISWLAEEVTMLPMLTE